MGTLKDKANKKRANRQERNVITPEATKIAGINTPDLSEPARMDVRRYKDRENVEAVTPVVPAMPDAAPKSIISKDTLSAVQGNAEVQNPAGITNPSTEAAKEATKPKTLSDYLAEQRANLVKDKTDAVKMQKYYALTDALGALGRMGGTAVGGAIAGDVLGGASNIPEYQPSRGYVDAFEKAKQANERIRALDDKEFQLILNKQQRDEEMAFKAQQEQAAREFKARESALERDWDIRLFNYKTEIEQAIADKNFDKKAQLEQAMEKDKQAFELALQNLRNQGNIAVANIRNSNSGKATPIRFKNGAVANIPDNYYKSLRRDIIGEVINGVEVDEDNIDEVISNNPNYVRDYLSGFGLNDIVLSPNPKYSVGITRDINGDVDFPLHISQIPSNQMDKKTQNSQSSNKTNAPAKKMDISAYKQKK